MSHDRLSAANHAISLISFSEVLASPVFVFSRIAPGERFSYRNNPFSVLFLAGKFSPAFFGFRFISSLMPAYLGTPRRSVSSFFWPAFPIERKSSVRRARRGAFSPSGLAKLRAHFSVRVTLLLVPESLRSRRRACD